MNKQLELVDFETAKLLKEKGFDWDVYTSYDEDGIESRFSKGEYWNGYDVNSEHPTEISAPTQALVQKWLRDVHSLDIDSWSNQEYSWSYTLSKVFGTILKEGGSFETYEQAELVGINEALELI